MKIKSHISIIRYPDVYISSNESSGLFSYLQFFSPMRIYMVQLVDIRHFKVILYTYVHYSYKYFMFYRNSNPVISLARLNSPPRDSPEYFGNNKYKNKEA